MKTTRLFPSVLTRTPLRWRRGLSVVAVLVAAGLAHAQGISGLPGSLVVYSNQTVNTAFTLTDWSGSNVAVTVTGPATTLLATYAVDPATGTDTSRSLETKGGTVGGPLALRLIAAETPTAVHSVTSSTVNVTVRAQPTVAYSTTNGFHDGHIDQNATSATLTVTRNSVQTVLWGRHSNTTLFPAGNVSPSGRTFALVPTPGRAGSDIFTVYATDTFGGWTNSITVALTVVAVPIVKDLDGSVTFDEDTRGTNTFSVAYAGNANLLTYAATFAPPNLIQSHTFLTVGGISTNRALVLQPYANANGNATCSLVVSDGTHTKTNTFAITVNPVPDPTSISGVPAEIFLSNKDPWTNVFSSASFSDPDDDRPSQEKIDVSVRDSQLQIVFENSTASAASKLNASLSDQTTWLRAITLKAADGLFGVVGSTTDIPVRLIARSRNDNLASTNTMVVHLYFQNTPPEFTVNVAPGQSEMNELETHTPFTLDSITDPDDTQTSFTLSLFLAPGYQAYGSLSKSVGAAIPPAGGVIGTGNRADLDLLLRNTQFSANEGVLVESQGPVYFVFELFDGFDTTVKTNAITLNQLRRPPVINLGNGALKDIYITSAAPTAKPYSLVYVSDPDEAGNQPVKAAISVVPDIGDIDMLTRGSMGDLQAPSALSDLLRAATFTPYAGALDGIAVGQSVSARITLTVTDETGLSDTDNEVVIHIERVNAAPELGVPEEQPVLFSPGTVIRPFADVTLASDDTNAVTFSFSIDNPDKGVFGNVDVSPSGFSAQGVGSYTITTAAIGHILDLVTNITFTPSGTYPFPPDDPSGTRFTLSAKDYLLLTTTRMLVIQVQDPPRNWLVTKQVNDGTPGTFEHALAHFANNDVITFALPSYPATIRMSATHAVVETGRTLTIKGPGADLLTVSGDSDGNGTPDRQILAIDSPVTIEGVTFADATAPLGGAFAILSANGKLTLRNVVIRDSVATQFGGAIDVYGGRLLVEGCAFLRNTVTADGYGGGAISTYTDYDIGITNTLFDSNVQLSLNGAGGAIFTEFPDDSPDNFAVIDIVHCTFADNVDASVDYTASSVYACSGTHVLPLNTIFADSPLTRTLNLDSGAAIWSKGGNICDDSTYVPYQQQLSDGSYSNYLLDPALDRLSTDARLAPLDTVASVLPYRLPLTNSPAIGFTRPSPATVLEQRGRLRVPGLHGLGVVGAIDPAAVSWPTINEIQLSGDVGDTDRFIEVFAPRNGQDVNLAGYTLFVNGAAVHEFGRGRLALTNNVYPVLAPSATIPASYILSPGRGVVVVFPKGDSADFDDFSPLNPTPVVCGSIVTNAADFADLLSMQGRGSVMIAKSATDTPIVRQTFLTVFNDPDSAAGTNDLNTAGNSLSLAPQFRGFALVPHSFILPGPFGGVDTTINLVSLLESPGADAAGTPFGQDNAEPLARTDIFTVTEDDVMQLDVLANDYDSDGNDRLVVVDISTVSDPGTGDVAHTNSAQGAIISIAPDLIPLRGEHILYDPRFAETLQQLPVGVEMIDSFFYEIIDIGSGAVEAYGDSAPGTTTVTVTHHRLATGDQISITRASVSNYNGVFTITVIDENSFTIPVAFDGLAATKGTWETTLPRLPTSRSETAVNVRVIGQNDPPVAVLDFITNVTEASTMRMMIRPERAGVPITFPGDPVPAPDVSAQDLLSNDFDIDTDDTWENLRVVGVLGAVNTITAYSGTAGATPVTVHAPAHGLNSGDAVLIANYGGHPSYNGYHTITVVDADTFTIPQYYVDDHTVKGVWVVLNDANRYSTSTSAGVPVTLTLRSDPQEDNLVYRAGESAFLNGLAEGEIFVDRFWYAVEDRHGAIGIGPVDVEVVGLNDVPVAFPDPGAVEILDPLVTSSNSLEAVLAGGLDLMYTRLPSSGVVGRTDLHVLDLGGILPGTLVLRDFFFTDEDTPLILAAADLLVNDTDIDRIDQLEVLAVDPLSRERAAVNLAGTDITYVPALSSNLQALARGEMCIDTFAVTVTDNMTGGTVTSLVAVLVIGVNDTPTANPDTRVTNEDECIAFDPLVNDIETDINAVVPDDRLRIVPVSSLPNPGLAQVDLSPTNGVHDATVSERLNQLADWQVFTNTFDYTVTDNSLLFATDDEFYVLAGSTNRLLDVLSNDRNFTDAEGLLTIIDAGPTLAGGTVGIVSNGQFLVYDAPPAFMGEDYFRYTIQNAAGDIQSGRVMVRSVVPHLNGILHAADDHYIVAAGETVTMDVLANDGMLPSGSAGLAITELISTSVPGQPVLIDNSFVFSATNGLAPLTFTYAVTAGGSSTARADVVATIVERRGTLGVRDDAFSVQPGSLNNALDVLSNDSLVTESTASLRIATLVDAASHGTFSVNAAATGLLYSPASGFIGIERIRYVATDQIGGTGTGMVSITVGRVDAVADFFKLEAANTNAVVLDVLSNDRTLPNAIGTLTIVSVKPSTPTLIGTLSIDGPSKHLRFKASGALGQTNFTCVIADATSPARLATGVVSIATVASGTYANPDLYRVRGGGAGYVLDVLANDRGFPNLNRVYSITGLGSGANAPNAGGIVTIANNKLVYTPAVGFFGEESFTYTLSDAFSTDVAQVTVTVAQGDLFANDDDYAIFYEWDAGAGAPRAFELPVTLNDRILPPLDQVFGIVALGVGANAPNVGGSVEIAPGGLSLLYRPGAVPATAFTERFTYEIADGTDRRAACQVQVRVCNRQNNLVDLTRQDAFTVARNSVDNLMPVLANDFILPGSAAGWTLTGVSATQAGGTVGLLGASVRYTPPTGFVGVDHFTYSVDDGLGGTGSGAVMVRVGDLPTLPSRFSVLAGSVSNRLDVLANDQLDETYVDEYALDQVLGTTAGGTVTRYADNTVCYTPAPGYAGPYPYTEHLAYTVLDDSAIAVTGMAEVVVYDPADGLSTALITMLVEGRNDPPVILNTTSNAPITDKQSTAVFGGVTLIEVDEQLMERLNVTVTIDDGSKGTFNNLQGFADVGGGSYVWSNVTAAAATLALRQLVYVPVENRILVPTNETVRFTLSITDTRSPAVVDNSTTLLVSSVNDAPEIIGTRAKQRFYTNGSIQPFDTVTVVEVDDLAQQRLTVTVMIIEPTQVNLLNRGDFADLHDGRYRATHLTAAEATAQLRAMTVVAASSVAVDSPVTTHLHVRVEDGFAAPVTDTTTSVMALNAYSPQAALQPGDEAMRGDFGAAVDTLAEMAIVGAPTATLNGPGAGAAFLYRHVTGSTNAWSEWCSLLPPSISAGDGFGSAVSLGNSFAAVGAPHQQDGSGRSGSVYLFRRDQGGTQNWGEWLRLVPTNAPTANHFGLAVDFSGDWLAVGAPDTLTLPGGSGGSGTVFLFGRHEGGLNAWGEVMRWSPSESGSADSAFGWQVALDGDTLVVGAPQFNAVTATTTREGAVFQFERNQGGTNRWGLVQKITCPDEDVAQQFGWSVAVRGGQLAVGAPAMSAGTPGIANAGRVYLYGRVQASEPFTFSAQLNGSQTTERQFGYSVALDGGRLFVGAPGNASGPHLGAAFLFENRTGYAAGWVRIERLTRPAGSLAIHYGHAVAFQQGTAIVGAPADMTSTQGSAYLYRFDYQAIDNISPVTIRAAWDAYNFGDAVGNPLTAASLWSGGADPDNDGMSNDTEYAFGGNPTLADQVGLLSIHSADPNWVFDYVRRANDPALFFVIEKSADLKIWSDCSPLILSESYMPSGADKKRVTTTLMLSPSPNRMFFRIKVYGL